MALFGRYYSQRDINLVNQFNAELMRAVLSCIRTRRPLSGPPGDRLMLQRVLMSGSKFRLVLLIG